ncbi:MAG: alpha-galactosidase [Parasporobacterium sp.]|nr:alpha-galactosidase [Parasporobacterium sp.]
MIIQLSDINIRYRIDGIEKRGKGPETEDYFLSLDQAGERTTITFHAKKPLTLVTSSFEVPYNYYQEDLIFVNGYQSWTDTKEYMLSEYIHDVKKVPAFLRNIFHFENYGDAWFMDYQKDNFHSFTYSYRKKKDGSCDLIGSLNEENAFLIIHYKKLEEIMSIRSDCGLKKVDGTFCLYDFVVYQGTCREVLQKYFANYGTCSAPKLRGYTSWYLHYQNINEEKIQTALDGIDSDHFELFQIDDGYETFVGDWMDIDPHKFPAGLKKIVEKIHAKGLKAGIWLAPFVCETKSRIFQDHPDWLYKENGKELFAGSNWSGFVVLDIRLPEVQEYIRRCLIYFMDLGFDFFKLDFLYAAALIHDGTYTRAEIMRAGMKGLREILKDKLILGCGVPLSSAFNLVDYCRIGPDVSLVFDDVFYMRKMHRERISTKVTIQNTIFRAHMDGSVFRCDPDVFLLRDDNIKLSKEQRKALCILNHLCGSLYLTSDNVGAYDAEKYEILKEAQKLTDAEITDISRKGNLITITYILDENEKKLTYNKEKGVLV